MPPRLYLFTALLPCACGFGLAAPLQAAAPATGSVGEIIVTANKRSEPLSKVAISATAIGQADLTQKGVQNLTDLSQRIPGLNIQQTISIGGPQITLRGIGSTSFQQNTESTVALYLDEFVLNPTTSKGYQLFDLQRVEVLRGPQGTLYGKNSTGGAINLITRRPSGQTDADGSITVGRFGQYEGQIAAETALTNDLAVRVALKRGYSDGYGFDTSTQQRTFKGGNWAGRIGIEYKSGDTDAYLKIFGDTARTDGGQFDTIVAVSPVTGAPIPGNVNVITGFVPSPDKDISAGTDQRLRSHNIGATLNVDQHLGNVTLSSISGYLKSYQRDSLDVDNSPYDLAQVPLQLTDSDEITQELRLTSGKDQKFSWIAGAVFFHQHLVMNQTFNLAEFGAPIFSLPMTENSTSFAGYADATLKLGPRFSLIGGVRLTTDHKTFRRSATFSFIGPIDDVRSKRWTEPTYRVGLNYQANSDTLLYVSFNHGYRSGAFDSGFTTSPQQLAPVNPEFVNNFEGGVKTALFDRHLRIAVSVYYVKFTDQQVLVQPTGGICCSILNAGKAHNLGFEIENTARITSNFDVSLFATVSHSKYDKFQNGPLDFSGATLGFLPKYNVTVSPEYRVPFEAGNLFVAPQFSFVGKARAESPVDAYGQDIQKPYTHIDGQLGYRADGFSVYAWVKNATNERHLVRFNGTEAFGFNGLSYAAPRSYGLTLTKHIP